MLLLCLLLALTYTIVGIDACLTLRANDPVALCTNHVDKSINDRLMSVWATAMPADISIAAARSEGLI